MSGRRREAQRAETRRLVVEAACGLFEAQGYERTTMRAVAEAAGVAVGTIFTHFPDKRALLSAAFHDELEAVVSEAFATLPDGALAARFLHLAARLYAFYARRPRLSRVMVAHAAILDEGGDGPLQAQLQAFLDVLAGLVEAAQGRGEVRAELDPADGALALWSDYFTALIAGLRAPELQVEGQLALLGRLVALRLEGMA